MVKFLQEIGQKVSQPVCLLFANCPDCGSSTAAANIFRKDARMVHICTYMYEERDKRRQKKMKVTIMRRRCFCKKLFGT